MWILAPLLLTLSSQPTTASSALSRSVVQDTTQEDELAARRARDTAELEVYQELLSRYNNDIGAHRFDCRKLKAEGVPKEDWPPSPLFDYYPKFVELGEAGNGRAQHWAIANSEHVIETPLERRRMMEVMFGLLVRDHTADEYMVDAIDQLVRARRLLDHDFVLTTLRKISETSGIAEIEAKALLGEASVLWNNGKPADPDNITAVVEIWQVLVDGYAGSDASKQAAQYLFTRTNRAMQKAQLDWVEMVRGLRDQGIGEQDWPSYPVGAYRGQFEALASAQHELSNYRTQVFYPAYEQAEREGVVATMRFISDDTSARYLALEWPWMDVKFAILQLLFESFPQEPWVYDEVTKLEDRAQRFDQARYVPLLGTLIEKTEVERTKYQAEYVLAKNLETARTSVELERALALYTDIAENSPVERQRSDAELARREFSWVMPGAEFSNFQAKDGEGLKLDTVDYRGRVLVLYFWGFWSPECVAELPWINGIHEKYAGEQLAVLGVNNDTISYRAYGTRSAKAGIGWRSVLDTRRRGPRVKLLGVWNYPSSVIIDAEGVIRGRNLDRDATEALIVALLAELSGEPAVDEVEDVAPDAAPANSGLRGRVTFDGPREPLKPLKFSEEQTAGCCAAGHEVDPTNRKRLVDETGGLANVVVRVEVKDVVVNGTGVEVVMDQVECRFEPHVAVVPVGGSLLVKNSDSVSHNVNMNSRYNGRINEMMPANTKRQVDVKRADKMTIGCDVHPWMSSHVFVVETPYWALTGPDGRFEIPGLPPGEHVARYWHEELGELKSERFTVEAGKATELELVMKEKSSRRGGRGGRRN